MRIIVPTCLDQNVSVKGQCSIASTETLPENCLTYYKKLLWQFTTFHTINC